MSTNKAKLTTLLENAVGGKLRERVRKLVKDVRKKKLHQPLQEAADAAKWFDGVSLDDKDSDSPGYEALIKLEAAREQLDNAIETIRPGLKSMRGAPGVFPSGENIVKEMHTLDSMYCGFKMAEAPTGEQVLIATTTEVTLKDPEDTLWDFGKFEVVIDLDTFTKEGRVEGSNKLLRIYALTPNRCADSANLTHPHVSNHTMCTGGKEENIRKAQETSSVADLLEAVGSVIHTYNPRSPYHALEAWGTAFGSCVECGDSVRREADAIVCTCGAIMCKNCSSSCAGCGQPFCSSCLTRCKSCNQPFCKSTACAIHSCSICSMPTCASCLSGSGRCATCAAKEVELETIRTTAAAEEESVEFSEILKRGVTPTGGGRGDKKRKLRKQTASPDPQPSTSGRSGPVRQTEGGFLD